MSFTCSEETFSQTWTCFISTLLAERIEVGNYLIKTCKFATAKVP